MNTTKKAKGEILIEKLLSGENIALITDAGMPGVSDPGEDIIKSAIENNIEIIALPGATASITALVVSGFPQIDLYLKVSYLLKVKIELRN